MKQVTSRFRLTRVNSRRCPDRPGMVSLGLRAGFTLIEVLIALSLSLILISAIYSAVSLHWRFEEAGRERIDRAQISLAILRRLSEDIGSVDFTAPSSTSTEDEESEDTGIANTGTTSSETTDTTASTTTSMSGANSTSAMAATTSTSLGIVGTAESLQLDLSYPTRQDFVPEATSASGSIPSIPALSDNVRVTWGMVTPSATSPETNGLRSLTVNPALARQMVDRLRTTVTAEDESNRETTLDESSILAKEVISLQFRYYDGYAWSEEWDSVTKERLPRAIEVTMGFIQPEYKRPGSLNLPGSETIVSMKHVIFVPASSPVSGEEI